MNLIKKLFYLTITGLLIMSCANQGRKDDFKYVTEQFADLRIQR